MLGGIYLGVRPVLARMPYIPCVFGVRTLNAYDDDEFLNLKFMDVAFGILQLCCMCVC